MLTFVFQWIFLFDRQWEHRSTCHGEHLSKQCHSRASHITIVFWTSICFWNTWNEFLSTSNTMYDVVEPLSNPSIVNLNKSTVFEQLGCDGVSAEQIRLQYSSGSHSVRVHFTQTTGTKLTGHNIWHNTWTCHWIVERVYRGVFTRDAGDSERGSRCGGVASRGRNDARSGRPRHERRADVRGTSALNQTSARDNMQLLFCNAPRSYYDWFAIQGLVLLNLFWYITKITSIIISFDFKLPTTVTYLLKFSKLIATGKRSWCFLVKCIRRQKNFINQFFLISGLVCYQ